MSLLGPAALVLLGYLVGAVPWGIVLGRFFAATDLRDHGSRSTGATNAYRVLGARISVAVLVLDVVKGLLPVVLARAVGANPWVVGAVAVATVIGHCWSVFIRFTGGKGMATGGGAIVALSPWTLLILPVMVLVVAATRYVSLASVTGAAIAALAFVVAAATGQASWGTATAAAIVAAIIIYRHRGNIERLRAGTERKLTKRPATA